MSKSLLSKIQPSGNAPRSKIIDWPLDVEGEKPKVRLRALSMTECEAAHLAAAKYFKDGPAPRPGVRDALFVMRERAELVIRAFADPETGEPIGDMAELMKEPPEVRDALFAEFDRLHGDIGAKPPTSKELADLVALLKKKQDGAAFPALPGSWLVELVIFMGDLLSSSTAESSST